MKQPAINKIFESKKNYHKQMTKIPFEKKIEILIELQKIDLEMRKASGRKIKPHEIVWKF